MSTWCLSFCGLCVRGVTRELSLAAFSKQHLVSHRSLATMVIKGKKWIMKTKFQGHPTRDNFDIVEYEVPEIKDGEVLAEAVVFSVDPYMRPYMDAYEAGATMIGEQIAKVKNSKSTKFPVGTNVLVSSGWITHTVASEEKLTKVPEFPENVPISYALGGLGMPGKTAWLGLFKFAELKEGETVFVTSAAGAVGTAVGQLAKIKGCRAIGSAGSDEKVKFLTEELGFDGAFNYKTTKDHDAKIKELAPNGIDVFFENVGGEASTYIYNNMNAHGRVSVCGSIADYNSTKKVTPKNFDIIGKRLRVQGFVVWDNAEDFDKIMKDLIGWAAEGKLKLREKVHNGFDKLYDGFMELFSGNSFGKIVVYAK